MKKLIILSIHLVLFSVILGSDQSNFKSAQPGEYWVILDDNIAVMKTPKTQSERTAFNQHLVTIIGKNTKVNVLESTREGWFSVWHKVNVISDDGVLATGWVLAEIVKSAEKSTRSESNAFMNNWGLLRFAHSTTDIQASRNASSKVVGQLKPNQEIKVDFSKDGWWAVFDIDESYRHETNAIGYVLSPLLFPEQNEGTSATETSKQLLQFRIVKQEDVSYRGTSRMVYRVLLVVEEIPQKQAIEDVALSIWQDGNKSWKEFTVFLYLPEMNTNSSAYGIANFTPSGFVDFNIQDYTLWGTKWAKD